jgi:hypothetical protein
MRRHTLWLAIALLLAASAPRVARACPLCADAATATSGADEEDATREARAYNNSIFLMAGMPYLMLGGVGFWVYRGLRRHNALTSVPAEAAPTPEEPAPNPDETRPG